MLAARLGHNSPAWRSRDRGGQRGIPKDSLGSMRWASAPARVNPDAHPRRVKRLKGERSDEEGASKHPQEREDDHREAEAEAADEQPDAVLNGELVSLFSTVQVDIWETVGYHLARCRFNPC